jgi:hypothetical protein
MKNIIKKKLHETRQHCKCKNALLGALRLNKNWTFVEIDSFAEDLAVELKKGGYNAK